MKLVASYTSPYARKVRVVMAEKRIDCDFVEENVWNAETSVGLYNPLTKVPVLVLDDGLALYDSRVICEYLDGITPVSRLLPEGGRERALVKRLEALGDGITDAGVTIFLERKRPADRQSADWLVRQAAKIDAGTAAAARDLGERKYFSAETPLLGDIALACGLLWLEFRLPEFAWRATYPNLKAWVERLETRTSFVDTVPK